MTKKGVLLVAVITLITVIAWVIFDVYHTREQVQLDSDVKSAIEPLDPNFDLQSVQ